jgi:PH domain/leucine-rich repeat-containing protein phosphatase
MNLLLLAIDSLPIIWVLAFQIDVLDFTDSSCKCILCVRSCVCIVYSLRVLHLHNNHLTTLPDPLVVLRSLNSLALAFNRFASLPVVAAQMTNIRLADVECISLAGNQIERVSSEAVAEMKYARRLDLRLNSLTLPTTDTLKFTVLDRLTHMNVSDNRIAELDLHSLRSLEYLNCERNSMASLHLNGAALRTLLASDNRKWSQLVQF